jgi:ribonucleoside-triphosphate reductase
MHISKKRWQRISFNSVKIATAIKKASDEVGEKLKESELLDIVKSYKLHKDLGKRK